MKDTIAFQIVYLYRQFLAYTTAELKKLGLNFGQMPFLLYIGNHSGCTQSDLTSHLRIDWGYCHRSVARLAETGFLRKDDSGKLTLTETGDHAFSVCHGLFRDWDEDRLSVLTGEEREQMFLLLNKLTTTNEASHETV